MAQAQETSVPTLPTPPVPLSSTRPIDNGPEVTLEELIRRASVNNPRLDIARENLNAARESAKAARSVATPTLQLVPGFAGSRDARDEEVILAQPLDLFGARRARAQVSEAEVRRAQADNSLTQRALIVAVKYAATLLFAAQEAENLEQVQVEVAQLFRDAAAKRAQLGDVPPVQMQRAELELLRLQNDLANARTERLTRRTALNLLLGQAPATPLRVALPLESGATDLLQFPPVSLPGTPANPLLSPDLAPAPSPSFPSPSAPATSATVGGATVSNDVAARPDIASAQATLESRQAEARAVQRERLPAVELQARRSSFFGREGSYALRAVVTLPLFDFGALKGARRAALADARAQAATVKLLQQQAVAQLENARVQLAQSRQNVARYRDQLLPLTLDLLRKTQVGYAQGASTYLEVLEAQRTLRQVQTEYLQALVGVQNGENASDAALNGGAALSEAGLGESAVRGATR